MSFDLDITRIIKYAYNVFASADSILYLFIGASFGIFILAKLVQLVRDNKSS